jgi:hypothetical protein
MKCNKHRIWDDVEKALLEQRTAEGASEKAIASELGRSTKAVNVQKNKLGIKHALPLYVVVSPEGYKEEFASLSAAARKNWGSMGEAGSAPAEDIRRTSPCIGLEWALRTGRAWKGWRVRLLTPGTKPGRRKKALST